MLFIWAISILGVALAGLLFVWIFRSIRKKQYKEGYRSDHEPITSADRGNRSERRLINILLNNGYKRTAIYHDLYTGNLSQVDAVLCTDVGLIVIEVKDYMGWLFADGRQQKWTQVSGYGQYKYHFYNPILQNAKHIEALKGHSDLADIPMYSLVVFFGNCTFKALRNVPKDTLVIYSCDLIGAIEAIVASRPIYQYADKWAVANTLKYMMDRGSDSEVRRMQQAHVQQYLDKYGLNDNENHADLSRYAFRFFRLRR